MRMGLKLDFGFWDKEVYRTKVFNVVGDTPIYTSPKRITLESPSNESTVVEVNQSLDVSFKVASYNAITGNYPACEAAVVVFKSNGGKLSPLNAAQYARMLDGVLQGNPANVNWQYITASFVKSDSNKAVFDLLKSSKTDWLYSFFVMIR